MIIGVISDTHGLLPPEALAALQGSEHIIHAGDIGDAAILDRLREIAPITAIRGNVDRDAWANSLPNTNALEIGGITIYVIHNLQELDLKPGAAGFAAVIYGHTHIPKSEIKNGVLFFNPGSAGPKRFRLPVTLGKLQIRNQRLRAEIVQLV